MATFRCAVHQITWERDLEKALDDIGAWGYPGTETFSYVVQEFAGREAEFKAMLDARGLQLAALYSDDNGYEPGSEAETIERNLEIVRFLQALGADILVYGPGRPRPDPALPEHFEVVAHTVNEIARASHEMGVTTAIHPHWQALIQERDDITRIFDMVDTKYAKLAVDPSHMVKAGYDPVEVCDTYGEIIAYMHIKDFSQEMNTPENNLINEQGWTEPLVWFTELGQGVINHKAVIESLRRSNYEGWLTVEIDLSQTTPTKSLESNSRYLIDELGFDLKADNH